MRNWRDQAACRDKPDDAVFFPLNGSPDSAEKMYCGHCPVRVQCLHDALKNPSDGVRAGTSFKMRQNILRRRDRRKCPSCSGKTFIALDTSSVCVACGLSWLSPTPPSTSTRDL